MTTNNDLRAQVEAVTELLEMAGPVSNRDRAIFAGRLRAALAASPEPPPADTIERMAEAAEEHGGQ